MYKHLFFSLSVFDKYKSYSPYDMQESIVKEVKGDLQKSFLVLGTIHLFFHNPLDFVFLNH